ncbi:isoaspartyl peptidase/L-asparaginase [Alteriqipengyuania lutimaris]|uniref:Isoaspartyl peptidase n=1 Tax=Alteriqipengyuania lutimaris TaxID=1538146 RepID=A0A395LLI0_9SPHN|nr:isoaspartyl peptidase/L-asparaginase [Alteriqipengyuania lutimaris]MBB3033088.1 beta-aspartyl-peptidase (threonine type) [Alteriqipengyuania lutimaris]RDS77848.1 peptidase T [Alteriqipengyuania lutimaris]
MQPRSLVVALLAALSLLLPGLAQARDAPGYTYYETGDLSDPTPGVPSPGLLLIGGSDWSKPAWRWFAGKAGGGHLVILRASQDGSDGEWLMENIGGLASVQTLVFANRDAAFDPRVGEILAHADGIFIAGGDQSKYVRFWRDTPVEIALNAHMAAGRPIGGTSAGLAILGGTGYGALAEEAVDSREALADPRGSKVTLVSDFLTAPFLGNVITDTHFSERDRLGRLVAFLAQARAAGNTDAIGLGIDEDTALCVEADGTARLHTTSDGHAWLVRPQGAPGFEDSGALEWAQVELTAIGKQSRADLAHMTVSNPAVSGTAQVSGGELSNVPAPPARREWSLAIHGGSGVIERGDLTPEMEAAYRASLQAALAAGSEVLENGGTSLDAVEATLRILEDDPLFNAGRGAVFDAEGRNQLDAAIMDGATLNAGAVAAVSTTKHPVTLARAVLENSRHVLLSGDGADQFAREQGIEQVDPSYFRTEHRWRQIEEWRRDNLSALALDPTHRFGTVGAVALDKDGNLAAATSTGGLTGKRWGRIGDSPIIGAGTYAANGKCAVSGTGTGEYFIRESAGRQVCDRVAWNGQSIAQAADDTIGSIGALGGDGGLIAMDAMGRVAFAMNTEGMYRGAASSDYPAQEAIYADETLANED